MISVIIPTYKRAKYIERAINSVLNQTYKDIEIIVVDDNDSNSEDRLNMENVMNKYRNFEQIKYIKHERNRNGAVARNTGIQLAKGEYISFLDDDDFYISTRLEKLYNALEKNPEYDAIYSSSVLIDKHKNIVSIVPAMMSGKIEKDLLLKRMSIGTGSNLFFRASALKNINGFNESFKRHQDIEVLVRFCKLYKILNMSEILVVKDNSDKINRAKTVDELLDVKEKYMNLFRNVVEQYSEEEKKQFYFVHYLEVMYLLVENHEWNKIKLIKSKMENYQKFNLKFKLKLIKHFLNKTFKLNVLITKYKNKKNKKKIDEDIIREIKNA